MIHDGAAVDVPDLERELVGVEHRADRLIGLHEQLRVFLALIKPDLDTGGPGRVGRASMKATPEDVAKLDDLDAYATVLSPQ